MEQLFSKTTKLKGFEYLEDVIARARINAASYESGKDIGKPVFRAKGMAVDVGDLNNETFPLLPDNVKMAIIACHQLLTKDLNKGPEEILASMTQSPLLQSDQVASIKRTDIFMSKEKAWWNIFGGKSEETQIRELDNWLLKLVDNVDFSTDTHLHGDSSIKMAKAAMKIFQNLRKSCGGSGTINRDIINLAVLKYPQPKSRVIVERHLKVWAWVDCSDSDKNGGITGEYTKRQFTPRDSVISSLSPTIREKAIAKIEGIFAEIGPKGEKPAGPQIQYLKDVVARARDNLASYKSGNDIGEPVFNSKGVAVDIRNLNRQTFPLLPDTLKISIASCHKVLIKKPNASLDDIYAAMMANPFVEPNSRSFIHRQDKFIPTIARWWDILGKKNAKYTKQVDEWFLKFINDTEFLAATHLRGDPSVSMSEATMLLYKSLRSACGGQRGKLIKRDVIELVVLEYPSAENGVFNLHHVTLFAWVDCSTWAKKGGITGEYVKTEFTPREDVISMMSTASRSRALSFIEKIFHNIEPKLETKTTMMTTTTAPTTLSPTEFATTPKDTPTSIPTMSSSTDSLVNTPTDLPTTESVFTTASTIAETTGGDDVDE